MNKVALVTCLKLGGLTEDDELLLNPLRKHGMAPEVVVWDDPDLDWQSYSAVIIRSAWDYHYRATEFERWVQSLKSAGIPLWNPPEIILWNMNKRYLIELEQNGTSIVPTVFLERRSAGVLNKILNKTGWRNVVIKPDISASSYKTWIAGSDLQAGQQLMNEMLKDTGVLIQEFRQEIVDRGEWSIIFFDRKFSHAVIKKPAPGNFKVQQECGGSITPQTPPDSVLNSASDLLQKIKGSMLYARVDGIESDSGFLLMEVELIEPGLFLKYSISSAEEFADSILRKIN